MNSYSILSRWVAGSMVLLLCVGASAASQEELEKLSAPGLLVAATKVMAAEDYGAAIPYLNAYLDRMSTATDDRVLAMTQEVRFKLGKIAAYLEDSTSAAAYFKNYTEHLPLYRPREAFKLLAVNLYLAGQYEECVVAATNALAQPLPKNLPKKSTKVNYEELSKEEMAGFSVRQLKRIEKKAENAKDIPEGFSDDVPDAEPDYSPAELVLLNMTLADAYTQLGSWEQSLAPYRFVIENAVEEDRKGYATLQMVNALIALERFKEASEFVTKLYRTNARYDIRINMALIKAASALSGSGEFDSALMLYRMVLPRKDLVAYQVVKMNEIRQEAGLPVVELTIVTNDTGRLTTLYGNRSSMSVRNKVSPANTPDTPVLPPKPAELLKLEGLVETLLNLPPYETEVLYRTASLYAAAGRPWEAVVALGFVVDENPESELGKRAFAESLMILADPLNEYEWVEKSARPFLSAHQDGISPRMAALALTICYQKQALWKQVKQLLPILKGFIPSDDTDICKYECELYYMQAIADLMLFDYKGALAGFSKILVDFSGSHQQENATYWHAMSHLFLKDYESALTEFQGYLSVYPNGKWRPEVTFHEGICLFGQEKMEAAQARFTDVIQKYPKSQVYPDACSLRGDILASNGLLDEAKRDYEQAIASAHTPKQDTYAVFQLTSMLYSEKRYQEIIDLVTAYLKRRGDDGDVSKAAYWIGKTKLDQGLIHEAISAYREAIIQYGNNILQDGVDLIITELYNVSRRLEKNAREQLKEQLQKDVEAADNMTLKLRLRVLLSKMNGTELELGKVLIAELPDLTQAPPPVLAVICKASFAQGDYSRSGEILNIFKNHFEDSDFTRDAYKLRGYDLYNAGDLDGAMEIVKDVQALYGTQPDVAWAQLMKGRIQLKLKDFDSARQTFRDLLSVREWRGEAYAEATLELGKVEEAAGDLKQAFAWYQRAYFQYKGYANGVFAAEGYLASARCLQALGQENDVRNTYRAMLFDKYVNQLPQADVARKTLGPAEVEEINLMLTNGVQPNLTESVGAEGAK